MYKKEDMDLVLDHTHSPVEKESMALPNLDLITIRDLQRKTRLFQGPTVAFLADRLLNQELLELSYSKRSELSSVPSKPARNDNSLLI
jgi:hypothetical protein